MYAGIFSNKEDYECQAKRLIKRAEVLNRVYTEKNTRMINELRCGAEMSSDLAIFGTLLRNYEDKESEDLLLLGGYAENMDLRNFGECELW